MRDNLLGAAERLMVMKGFPATTVDEICAAAGVTKGSFFYYFKNKDALGVAVLDYYVRGRAAALGAASFSKESDPLAWIEGYLDWLGLIMDDPAAPPYCLLGGFAADLAETHPELRAYCAGHFARWQASLEKRLAAAKRLHAPHADIDPAALAEHLVAALEGALLLAKVTGTRAPVHRSLAQYRRYLRACFSR